MGEGAAEITLVYSPMELGKEIMKTALHQAAVAGERNYVDYLLTTDVDIDAQNDEGMTALHFAVGAGSWYIVSALLKAGADQSIRAVNTDTPLSIAELWGWKRNKWSTIAELLKEKACQTN